MQSRLRIFADASIIAQLEVDHLRRLAPALSEEGYLGRRRDLLHHCLNDSRPQSRGRP
jgi:hypothetical protein